MSTAIFCTTCGVPLEGSTCGVCGGSAEPLPLADGQGDLPQFPADAGKPELEWAFEAWSRGEHARVVSHCLSAEGAQGVKNRTTADGPAFVAVIGGIAVIIRIQTATGHMVIETPVARLPQTQYVGAMRLALELSASTRSAARYAVREDTLFLRIVGRLDSMTPAVVQSGLKSIVSRATDDAKVLSTSVHARVLSSKEHVDIDLEALPEQRPLALDSQRPPASLEKRTVPAEADPSAPIPSLGPASKPVTLNSLTRPPVSASEKPVAREPAPQRAPTAPRPDPARAITKQDTTAQRIPTSRQAPPSPRATPPVPMSQIETSRNPTVEVQTKPSPVATTPAGELCELLHKAQTLGAVLSFADQPATMALLIRATVYRVILGFDGTLPDAVRRLYADTQALTKEIYITAPGIRRGAMAIPSATPAFESMQAIVDANANVPAGEAFQISPITSSQDAKQHLARYVSEIDQAPKDLELRHFLALGALSELLVRAKLPAPTLERLRGIIAHAQRDGARQSVVDLMMTALSRMMA